MQSQRTAAQIESMPVVLQHRAGGAYHDTEEGGSVECWGGKTAASQAEVIMDSIQQHLARCHRP
jgi:hypothetical protein